MKRLIVFLVFVVILFSSCSSKKSDISKSKSDYNINVTKTTSSKDADIEITEQGYITMVNEIYNNMEKYIGKVVSIEGCFASEKVDNNTYNYVYRTGPGCCGTDGSMCGFEFIWDGKEPAKDEWINVKGKLFSYKEGDQIYLSIKADNVKVLTQRGLATVIQ